MKPLSGTHETGAGSPAPRPPARIYVIPATEAPRAVVFRRGPSRWWHILLWDLAQPRLTPGAWFRGNLYPRRSNISPDGRLLGYFALRGQASDSWHSYFAVSKAPWLTALAAWGTTGTWTTGCHFAAQGRLLIGGAGGDPFHGRYPWPVNDAPWPFPAGPHFHAYERGWAEPPAEQQPAILAHCLPRLPEALQGQPDAPLLLEKAQPKKGKPRGRRTKKRKPTGLIQLHGPVTWDSSPNYRVEYVDGHYLLQQPSVGLTYLPRAYWADWDHEGHLLMATRDGTLERYQVDDESIDLQWFEELTPMEPDPVPAPEWARAW